MTTLTDMVKNGKTVSFLKCDNGTLWYVTECGFEFPIPREDMNDVFLLKDKAMLFMRWIRKHIQEIESAKLLQAKTLEVAVEKESYFPIKIMITEKGHVQEGEISICKTPEETPSGTRFRVLETKVSE
jgi:hypothetical protein